MTAREVDVEALSPAVRWLMANGKSVSALGAEAADILWDVFAGIYHVQGVLRCSFAGLYVEVPIYARLATYDSDLLTRLVVLAHDRCVRVEVAARTAMAQYEGEMGEAVALVLSFSPRSRDADLYHRHPTLDEAVARARGEIR